MRNLEIAKVFRDIANILQIKGENVFRIRAYERAAQNIEGIPNIDNFITQDRLTEIPGIGKDLSQRIKEFASTGKIRIFEDLKRSLPEGLLDLLKVPSIGPKTAKLLYEKLKIKNIPELKKAIDQGKLVGIFGIKEKTVDNIKKGIEILKRGKERMTLAEAIEVSDSFIGALKKLPEVKAIAPAGSLRRQKDTVRDIDILVVSRKPKKVMQALKKVESVKDVQAEGPTKASVRTADDVQVDCRVVEEKSFGAALLYFTGSKNFNIKLRQLAINKGLKINEYGVFRKDKFVTGKTENEIFKCLGLPYIEPELREDAGEIELARKNSLPRLIQLADIKGDFHAHSLFSDGADTIEAMAIEAKALGYGYIAITDHSQSLKVAHGLTLAELKKKKAQIDKVNKKLKNFRVLFGTEADIDSKGRIDYPDKVLKEFDIVIAAVHLGFKFTKEQMTRRLIKACQNKYVHIIAHPTGKLWGTREGYEIDLEELLKAAKDTNTALEINAFPQRLDLNDVNCRRAKEWGVKLAIGTDSHKKEQLLGMRYGVAVARRGWLSAKDVLNVLSVEQLLKAIKK